MIDAGGEGHHIVHGEGGTSEQRRQSQQELYEFVLKTHERLVTLEKRRDACSVSSLEHLARYDVSVITAESGELHYVVNEVERGSGLQMYSSIDPSRSMEMMDELGEVLIHWLDCTCTT
jgi:hypothetical protein